MKQNSLDTFCNANTKLTKVAYPTLSSANKTQTAFVYFTQKLKSRVSMK